MKYCKYLFVSHLFQKFEFKFGVCLFGLSKFQSPSDTGSYVKRAIWLFGQHIKRPDLAEVVDNLYDAALKTSSKKTYNTGHRAYQRFASEINMRDAFQPFQQRLLGKTEFYLAFYVAWLVLKPSISAASTILSYETHVKYFFREEGCDPEEYNTAFLGRIRKGVENTFPRRNDKRVAFLLPLHLNSVAFINA